jgi:hypothetical protein
LAWVDPEVCIVSHENGRFGRDKDTHPHLEVVRALGDSGAAVLYTNHVRKGGTIVELAAVGGSFWTDPAVQFLD